MRYPPPEEKVITIKELKNIGNGVFSSKCKKIIVFVCVKPNYLSFNPLKLEIIKRLHLGLKKS